MKKVLILTALILSSTAVIAAENFDYVQGTPASQYQPTYYQQTNYNPGSGVLKGSVITVPAGQQSKTVVTTPLNTKKMFIAEILQLIAAVLLLISAVSLGAGVVSAFDGNEGAATGALATGGIFGALGIILPPIALILSLVGMWQASKDEPDRMRKAFWFAIAALVLGVLQGFVFTDFWSLFDEANWNWAGFLSTLESIAEMCMMIFAMRTL